MSNKLTEMALELLLIEKDLSGRFDYTNNKPDIDDFEVYIFEQTWGSTALGFSGIGGQAITSARTYVFIPVSIEQRCFVYFAGKFAYSAPYSQVFWEDVRKQQMAPVYKREKYYPRENKENSNKDKEIKKDVN